MIMEILDYVFIVVAIGWGVSLNYMLANSKGALYYSYTFFLAILILLKSGIL